MKTKEELKKEIYELAQKVSSASSEKFLLEAAREIYELAALLKYAPKDEQKDNIKKEEEKSVIAAAEPAKTETAPKESTAQPTIQVAIDLFSSETTETIQTETPPTAPQPEPQPAPGPSTEKLAPKEKKEPKKKATESVAEKLQHNKISDLKSAIGINEKFQFINELFEGNMKEYTVAVDQINSFSTHAEAESYMENLADIYKWQADNQIAENFKELVERRFA